MDKEKKLTPNLPKGFKDRYGSELETKKKIVSKIENIFKSYGYQPLETPALEISENIGSFLAEDPNNPMSDVFTFNDTKESLTLRYDLSAPLSRFIAQNYMNIVFPFKRYSYGDVFRQEKADVARFRSFSQFDADIIGDVNEAQADAEICNLIADSFLECGLKKEQFVINVSNKKILQGLLREIKIPDEKQYQVLKTIDKLDRLGFESVEKLLKDGRTDGSGAFIAGCKLSDDQVSQIKTTINSKNLNELKSNLKNELSITGINELEELYEFLSYGNNLERVQTNICITRGLSYYSSFVVETNLNFKIKNAKGKEVTSGSCGSGGRYNSLISRFKGADYKGTGMSIGIDRLLYALNQVEEIQVNPQSPVLVCILDKKYIQNCYEIINQLREKGINSEIYLDQNKNLKKQLQYADRKNTDLAIIIGENEIKENKILVKKLKSKKENDQVSIQKENLVNEIKKLI